MSVTIRTYAGGEIIYHTERFHWRDEDGNIRATAETEALLVAMVDKMNKKAFVRRPAYAYLSARLQKVTLTSYNVNSGKVFLTTEGGSREQISKYNHNDIFKDTEQNRMLVAEYNAIRERQKELTLQSDAILKKMEVENFGD